MASPTSSSHSPDRRSRSWARNDSSGPGPQTERTRSVEWTDEHSPTRGDQSSAQAGGTRIVDWTEDHEAELTKLKAKLKAAHKSWSAEQELYHDRHDHLEDLKRKYKKAGKKAAKLARKGSEEGKESGNKIGSLLRKMSDTIASRGSGSGASKARSRSNSESDLTQMAPLSRTRTNPNLPSRLRGFSVTDRKDTGEDM